MTHHNSKPRTDHAGSKAMRVKGAPYGPGDPLTTTEQVKELLEYILGRAGKRQVWMFFCAADGAMIDPIVPMDGLPRSPGEKVETENLGKTAFARVFSDRVRKIIDMIGAASCALVWERRGGDAPARGDIDWADSIARCLVVDGVTLRAQFLLHDAGLREIARADLRAVS